MGYWAIFSRRRGWACKQESGCIIVLQLILLFELPKAEHTLPTSGHFHLVLTSA